MELAGSEGCQLFLLSVGVGWGQGGERWEGSQVLPGKTLPAHRLAGVRAQEEINQPPSIGRIEN